MERFCFVIMGYGKKVDYAKKPRTLDLDKTYTALIKPAVLACGLKCVRSDEVRQSGVIDQHMYEMLLRADLVIADISTANPNALYELGVRHALRPYSTIVIKERDGSFLFDLNHLATLQYRHLGEDIGATEAAEKTVELKALITAVLARPETDSPVYTFLKTLQEPIMSQKDLEDSVRRATSDGQDRCAAAVAAGRAAATASDHATARDCFQRAYDLQRAEGAKAMVDPFIVQQLALHTYKAKQPDAVRALQAAQRIIEQLDPDDSTDPETLGIAGAIRSRLWEADPGAMPHLDCAIEYYGRGFELKRDYYNGENYARCLDMRANVQKDPVEAQYDRMTARKVRLGVISNSLSLLKEPLVGERPDYHWILATVANTAYALGDEATGTDHETRFRALKRPGWEVETFDKGKAYARSLTAAATPSS